MNTDTNTLSRYIIWAKIHSFFPSEVFFNWTKEAIKWVVLLTVTYSTFPLISLSETGALSQLRGSPSETVKDFFFFFPQHTEPLSLQTAWLRMATQSKTKEMSGMREWELEKKKKKKKACASNFRLSEKWEPDTVKADFSWSVYLFVVSNKWRQKCLHLNMKTPENPERDGESRERKRERERETVSPNNLSLRAGLQTQDSNQKIHVHMVMRSTHMQSVLGEERWLD